MDPNEKFLNNYTYDIVYNISREHRYPPSAINERGFIWRFSIWFNCAIVILSSSYAFYKYLYKGKSDYKLIQSKP